MSDIIAMTAFSCFLPQVYDILKDLIHLLGPCVLLFLAACVFCFVTTVSIIVMDFDTSIIGKSVIACCFLFLYGIFFLCNIGEAYTNQVDLKIRIRENI